MGQVMLRLSIGRKLALSSAVTAVFAGGAVYNQWSSNTEISAANDAVAREETILRGISQAQLAVSRIQLSYRSVELARSAAAADAAVTAAQDEAGAAAKGLERPIAIALKPDVLRESERGVRDLAAAVKDFAQQGRADLYGRRSMRRRPLPPATGSPRSSDGPRRPSANRSRTPTASRTRR